MHMIDKKLFSEGLRKRGYRTIGELADSLNIHRNTVHYYLSGHNVFPEALERIISALDLDIRDIIVKKDESPAQIEKIAPTIDKLQGKYPDVAFILFGSRAKGKSKKYSDWDIGVYRSGGLLHETYRNIIKKKNDLAENLPFFIDVVNFNNADAPFLREASKSWQFLTGSIKSFLELKRKAVL